jgi:Kef-type K+ transport system membrane component KefB
MTAEGSAAILHIMITIGILLFASKLFAELFARLKLSVVLGELLAGIIVGPFALGGLVMFDGKPLVFLDETVRHIGEIAAVVILFIAGLQITPREFLKGGAASLTVAACGVVVPFFVGFYVFSAFGLPALESMLIATALTATSVAITIQVMLELGKMQTKEARLILGAAIIDDILAIAVLSVVTSIVHSGSAAIPNVGDIAFLILKVLGLFAVLLVGAVLIMPRVLHVERLWKLKGSVEGVTTASFFGAAGLAAAIGLSPIVGSYAVGMAVANTRVIKQLGEYVDKLQIIFAPLFFAIIGAQVDFRGVTLPILYLTGILVAIAIVTKIVGTGLPALLFLKDRGKAMKVGIGMVSRGEVGLIVAGVGITAGVIGTSTYTSVIIMVAVTTLMTPILLKMAYRKEAGATDSGLQQSFPSDAAGGSTNNQDKKDSLV